MTYKFIQFNVDITDPQISVVQVLDNISAKECSVEVLLQTEAANFGVTLSGFTYTADWTDEEVQIWTLTELQKYAV
jgi:hypothetical protein